MSKFLQTETILVLSTVHLPEDVVGAIDKKFEWEGRELEDSVVEDWALRMTMYEHGEYGWLIHTGGDLTGNPQFTQDVPSELRLVIALAEANGCSWVLFDRDGAEIDALPKFEW